MKIKKMVAAFTVLMLIFMFLFLGLFDKAYYPKRDVVYYNDLLQKVQKDLESGKSEEDVEKEYGCFVIYKKTIDDPELIELYEEEAFVLDLICDGEYVGKVAWLDRMEKYDSFGFSFLKISLIVWGLTLFLGYALLFMIYRTYERPSAELKRFSEELAKGNLDIALPIRKNTMFGNFEEAFDIMREELKKSQRQKMDAEIARKELVTSLSHDVKTPVAVIDATCQVLDVKLNRRLQRLNESEEPSLEDIKETEDSIEKIKTISSKAGTISSLMSDLLHLNLDDSEKVKVNAVEEYSTLIEDYLIKIRNFGNIQIKDHIPKCLVYMDRQRMEQVIDNVVGNSVKYAGTKIDVSFDEVRDVLTDSGKKAGFIRITIKDHGPGVSEDDLPLVAQKYYRGSNAGDSSGYGMGLFLVKQYMQKQGGDMEYYNDNGFTVVLMLKKV